MTRERVLAISLLVVGVAYAQRSEGPQPAVVDPGGPGKAPSDAIVLFNGRDNSGWTTLDDAPIPSARGPYRNQGAPSKCTVADGVMTCRTGAGDVQTTEKFRDAQIHLEFQDHSRSVGRKIGISPGVEGPAPDTTTRSIRRGHPARGLGDAHADYSSRSEDVPGAFGTHLWGDEGTLFVGRFGYEVRPVTGNWRSTGGKPPFEEKKVALHDELPNGQASFESDSGRLIVNFLACIKSRERPVCDIEIGATSTIPTLMGGLSIRSGGKAIAWNGHGAEPLA